MVAIFLAFLGFLWSLKKSYFLFCIFEALQRTDWDNKSYKMHSLQSGHSVNVGTQSKARGQEQ